MKMNKFCSLGFGSDLPLFERSIINSVFEMLYLLDYCDEDFYGLAHDRYIETRGMIKGFLYAKIISCEDYDLLYTYLEDCYTSTLFMMK